MSSDSWYDSGVNFVGGLLEKGMEGYIEVEKAKASNPANQAASQDATFNSPTIDENPTAKNGQNVSLSRDVVGYGNNQVGVTAGLQHRF